MTFPTYTDERVSLVNGDEGPMDRRCQSTGGGSGMSGDELWLGSTALPHRRRKVSACQARWDNRMGGGDAPVGCVTHLTTLLWYLGIVALDVRLVVGDLFFPISGLP